MSNQKRTPAGVSEGGQFANATRNEADVSLVTQPAQRHIELLIAAGRLSPAARGMDPREALEQMTEAEALTFSDSAAEFALAGLAMRAPAASLAVGDTLVEADGTHCEIEHVKVTSLDVELELDDGRSLVLGTNEQVDFTPGPGRCAGCGSELDGAGWDGYCGECADAVDADY